MPTFEELMQRAKRQAQLEPSRSDYWRGYIRGLWKGHYGQDVSPNDDRSQLYNSGPGDGYHAGLLADLEKESN